MFFSSGAKIQKKETKPLVVATQGPLHKRVEVWVYNSDKQLLCARHAFSSKSEPGKWQSYLSSELSENQNYLESGLYLIDRILRVPRAPANLTELHLRLNDTATVFTRVYALMVDAAAFSLPQPNSDFMEYRWMSLYDIELAIKNREFTHPMDYQVVEFLKNP